MDKLVQWRDGLISDAEIISWLLVDLANVHDAIAVVQQAMIERETKIADERLTRLGVNSAA